MDDFDLTFDICDEDRLDFEANSFEADEIEDSLKPKPKVIKINFYAFLNNVSSIHLFHQLKKNFNAFS